MSITELFQKLDAPLHNSRWSWGAVRKDEVVFLRVWRDEHKKIDGKSFVCITANEYFQANDPSNLGYQERLKHVALLKGGAKSFMVMCIVKDEEAMPRVIDDFVKTDVFSGGQLMEIDGEYWLELKDKVQIKNA